MKSIVGMFIIFFCIYIVVENDVFVFLAQKQILYFSVGLAFFMLVSALVLLSPCCANFREKLKKEEKSND